MNAKAYLMLFRPKTGKPYVRVSSEPLPTLGPGDRSQTLFAVEGKDFHDASAKLDEIVGFIVDMAEANRSVPRKRS